MKKDQIPQDDANLLEGKTRDLCYAVDENGNYITGLSTGWDPKNAALQHALDFFNERAEKVKEKVIKGKLSPLAYFMEARYMDAALLADYMELSKRVVKRHMKPKFFNKLEDDVLKEYAEILRIEFSDLKDFPTS
ncbi:MAG: hypothetical protein CL840_09690 [Crocinitomicaceae bacterium]|nr:hypothetical protein [Crocinitomicaceae bacterium]|tara:strand:+ start:762 stop:1166 length:405 start_codon:yes stop_codon:yes gene_type:complete